MLFFSIITKDKFDKMTVWKTPCSTHLNQVFHSLILWLFFYYLLLSYTNLVKVITLFSLRTRRLSSGKLLMHCTNSDTISDHFRGILNVFKLFLKIARNIFFQTQIFAKQLKGKTLTFWRRRCIVQVIPRYDKAWATLRCRPRQSGPGLDV